MAVKFKGGFNLYTGFLVKKLSIIEPQQPEEPSDLEWFDPLPGSLGLVTVGDEVEYDFIVTDPNNNITGFSIVSGSLPLGLEMNPYSGQIYGVLGEVDEQTNYTFRLKVTDLDGNELFGDFSISVKPLVSEVQWVTPEGEIADLSGGSGLYTRLEAQSIR